MSFRIIYIVCCFVLFWGNLKSQDAIRWDDTGDYINIADKVSLLEDKSGKLTLEQVMSPDLSHDFTASDKVILNFGFTESSYWIRFVFDNTSSEDLVLELAHTHIEKVNCFIADSTGKTETYTAGFSMPMEKKPLMHHFQIFPLAKGRAAYYIRISPPVQPLPVRIYKNSAYEVKTYRQHLVYGFYAGVMFFVIISNLFFFYSLRNRLFLFYSGLVLLYLSYASIVMDGFILYLFRGIDLRFWYLFIPTIGVPLQMLYALIFLEVRKYAPALHKMTTWLIAYFIVYAVLRFFLPLKIVLAMNTIHALISFFGMFYLGYRTSKKGNRLGFYFAMAYLIYFLLVLTEATYVQVGKPGYFAELSHVAWATLIEALILSFLLSKKFEWEKEETELQRKEAQEKLVEKTLENERIVREQNVTLEKMVSERTTELASSLENLRQTQNKLIQSEKLASLGELTAGIAHEIQNPLNFVNNFADVSAELSKELMDELQKPNPDTDVIKELSSDLMGNQEKIRHHGMRASSIIKGMLQHSRSSTGQKEATDINNLCDEYIRLAFHGLRAKDKSFNSDYSTDFDSNMPLIPVIPQELGRVLLNLLNNAFYSVQQKSMTAGAGYKPKVTLGTKYEKDSILITVTDNGMGVSEKVKDKIFQPFFTTKPTGEGTGLGLSLAYDIITNVHNGSLDFVSKNGEGTVFMVRLPVKQGRNQ